MVERLRPRDVVDASDVVAREGQSPPERHGRNERREEGGVKRSSESRPIPDHSTPRACRERPRVDPQHRCEPREEPPLAKLEDVIALAEGRRHRRHQDYREGESASFTTFAWSRIWGSAKNGLARERSRTASIPARLSEGMAEGRRHALDYAEGQRDT